MQTYDVIINEATGSPIDIATGNMTVPRVVSGDACTVRVWLASVDAYNRVTYQQQEGATVTLSAKYYDGTELVPSTTLSEVKSGSEYFYAGSVDFGTANIDALFDDDAGVTDVQAKAKLAITNGVNVRSHNFTIIIEEP